MEILTGFCIKGLGQIPLNYCQDGFLTGCYSDTLKQKAGYFNNQL
jgi:hypothetical protein